MFHLSSRFLARASALLTLAAGSLLWSGCSTMPEVASAKLPLEEIAKYSPKAAVVTPIQALDGATEYVKAHPGSDYEFGSGDSMLPLYKDHAVIITERPPMAALHVGQTVVFMGQRGVPVAHILLRHDDDGWVTMGVGNLAPDEGRLNDDNFIGVVVKAYQPTGSAILAYAKSAPKEIYASNP
jgi:hypothetical protein